MTLVAVNALFVVPGVVGGSEDYTVAMLRSFAKHGPSDIELRIFGLESFRDAYPDLAESFEFEAIGLSGALKPARIAAESTWLERVTARHQPDIQHHFGGRIPGRTGGAQVVTLHDLQPLDHPENFGRFKRQFLARAIPRSMQKAGHVITVSESVRSQVIDRFGLAEDTVTAIPAGLGPRQQTSAPLPGGLPSRFFVYPAVTHPHKNHRVLLEAVAIAAAQNPAIHVVLVGGAGAAEQDVRNAIAEPSLAKHVTHLGRVDRATVDALLAASDGLIFPSSYEGFGLPVLEGFAAGAPVLASDIPPINGVVGSAGILVDPDDVVGWVEAMLSPPTFDAAYAKKTLAQYSPQSRAAELAEVYRSLMTGSEETLSDQ